MKLLETKTGGKRTVYALSFFIPFCLLFLLLYALGVYPFGDKTLLISDMQNQYISYLSYYKTLFTSGNDLFYTFSKNLGGDMTGFAAYYLLSPLNLILLLFPDRLLPAAVTLIIVLKLSLCGLTFNYLINAASAPSPRSLIFSTTYALMGYNVVYFFNVMWLDGVALLPLMALGIQKIISQKKWLLYMLSLAAALIINYYIGFMLCIFSVLYFLYRLFLTLRSFSEIKKSGGTIGMYLAASLAAGGLSAFVLLPTFASLQGGKAAFSLSILGFSENFPFLDVFSKLFVNSTNWTQIVCGLPNIFCGVFIVVLVLLYFLNTNIKLRDKLLSAAILAAILISFHVNTFNKVWHGFNTPGWFPYRYSFVFAFLLISIGYESLSKMREGVQGRQFLTCGAIVAAAAILIFRNTYEYVELFSIYLDVFLALAFCALLYGLQVKPNAKRVIVFLLALLQFAELSLNAYGSVSMLQTASSAKMSSYTDFVSSTAPAVRRIQQEDDGLYRIEKTFRWSLNDSMLLNYKGLSHFSSSEKSFVKAFMGKIGFCHTGNWAIYNQGCTAAADALLGVKYLLSTQGDIDKPYEKLFTENGVTCYKNPYALPLGFGVSDLVLSAELDAANPFEAQNTLFDSMTGGAESQLLVPGTIAGVTCDNLTIHAGDGYTRYQKIDESADAYVNYEIPITSEDVLYAYLDAPADQAAELFVNGVDLGSYFDTYDNDVISLGSFADGDVITLSVKLRDAYIDIGNAYVAYEDAGALERCYAVLSSQACALEEVASSHIEGTTAALKDDYLLFSIPYEKNWHVYVDGKEKDTIMAFGVFLAVEAGSGTHSIELRYIPNGLYAGIGISVLTLLAVFAACAVRCAKRRRDALLPAGLTRVK